MGDRLRMAKPHSRYVTAIEVDSAFYPTWDGKMSASFFGWKMIINGDDGYALLAAYRRACDSSRLAWSKGQRPPGTVLYSSREPIELSQWFCHDDSTVNIVVDIIIVI